MRRRAYEKYSFGASYMEKRVIYYQEGQMSGGMQMKRKWRHLVMELEILGLAILCIQLGMKRTEAKKYRNRGENIVEVSRPMQADKKRGEIVQAPRIALTFDDGPSSKYTPLLLEGLKKREVHATFFLIGQNIEGNEELVGQIQEEGHLIGNHTYHHVELDKITADQATKEIEDTNKEIYEITGEYPSYVRPPYGVWKKNLDFEVTMYPVLWDIDTLDWKSQNVESVLQIVLTQAEDGAIILMHDSYRSSVNAALRIVDLLKCQGYEFVTVDKLITL